MKSSTISRLVGYAGPFRKKIFFALLILLFAAGAELTGPFIAKIAIDEHILGIEKPWIIYPNGESPAEAKKVDFQGKEWVREDWITEAESVNFPRAQILQVGMNYYVIPTVISFDGERKVISSDQGTWLEITLGKNREKYPAVLLSNEEVKLFYELEISPLLTLVFLYVGLILVSAGLNYIQLFTLQSTAHRIIQRLRIELFSHLQRLSVSFFDKTPTGQIITRVTNDTEAIREMFVSVMANFVQNGIYLIGIFIALFILQPRLALLTLAIMPILAVIILVFKKYSSRNFSLIRAKLSEMNATINESIQGMTIIQAFRKEKEMEKEFNKLNEEYFQGRMREIKLDGLLLRPVVDLINKLVLALIIWYFGSQSLRDVISLGVLYAYVDYLGRFFEPVNMIMERLSNLQQALVSSERVFKILDEPPCETDDETKIPRPKGHVTFEHVWFAYKNDDYVLKDISFEAKPGQTVALVGHTGSGKSSIMNLLLRFYEANKGRICIDGGDIKSLPVHGLRHHMALVLQDPFLFTGDIQFNVRLYDDSIALEQVKDALKAVGADQFIERLPDKYEESVKERGSTLSAGQRQLITFARALVYNPAILILDEATASIDSETEALIQSGLQVLSKGRTTFIIAHRLSTIQHADQILVLHRGQIVERGTHEELMEQKGRYYKMYQLQKGELNRVLN
ncbi:ABC transporter ATP-binding protein/permease [Microaerobacter geothermalis]|uniref:ABC transporter ATP-binding protein n=1 Tax=Microaerobacter geothermalis TaxID=674972 RepID=UPI001F4437E8|nr:ABC transporter ATP-binding protein [Microaerobacter geothermalis]MCF6095219.1 ABC transporter ATP-binding protein/permease [Microaerobacter geothermalis]